MLDEVGAEVDGHVVRRSKSADELLAIDDDRDMRVVETGIDGEVDNALDFGFRLSAPVEDELRCTRLGDGAA